MKQACGYMMNDAGDAFAPHDAANPAIAGGAQREAEVYERLGTVVRALHDTLREIGADDVLAEAASEFPSARDRLRHIAALTESAANRVLGQVEQNAPVQERLAAAAGRLAREWESQPVAALPAEQQRLIGHTRVFLSDAQQGCGGARVALSDIMMAQAFQDLTGQLIGRVVKLLERTENDLLKLLIDAAPPGMAVLSQKQEATAGPGAPGAVALDQERVDGLLAELGF